MSPEPPFDSTVPRDADVPESATVRYAGGPTARPGPGDLLQIPGYDLLAELGRGAMGVVYRARDRKLNRDVALKMVLGGAVAGPERLVRFLAEAEALAALHHPHVVQVYDRGECHGLPYFTMEYCPGGSLAAKVKDNPLTGRSAAEVIEQLARGVEAAHARNILHRDLKPDNVLLAADGTPKLTDFGLAKRFDDSGDAGDGLTRSGAVMGTPSYMAPEQARGDTKRVGPAADVYALGAVLYRLVTGRPPFLGANSAETIRQVIDDDPVSPTQLTPTLPLDVATICLKCLAKEPGKRYPSAADMAADLRRYLEGRTILARPVGSVERAAKWVKRNPVVTGATVAVVLALAAGTVVSYVKYRDAEAARAAEAERVVERDRVIGERDTVIGERDTAIRKRDTAIADADRRAADLKYHLGWSSFLLAVSAYDNRDVVLAAGRLDQVPSEQRRWEWHYLKREIEGGIFTLRGHTGPVRAVAVTPDGARVVTGGDDRTARVWDARAGQPLLVLRGHAGPVRAVAVTPDGARVVTGGDDRTARVWDARTGQPLLELRGHAVPAVAVTPDGARVVTASDRTARVWDATTDRDDPAYRWFHTRVRPDRLRGDLNAARAAGDRVAERFWSDRLAAVMPHTPRRFRERQQSDPDPRLIARAAFHTPGLAAEPYDRAVVAAHAAAGDRLALRIVAQELIRAGRPAQAIPLLVALLPARGPNAPPVEELLIAKAYLARNDPGEAGRYYRAAVEWLDRPRPPIRAADMVTHGAVNPWAALGAAVAPVADPRYNTFDWEAWHDCQVFRAEVEGLLAGS